ncbi:hypothetical protein KCU72_g14774, partial [Aureobasidium melanogenum]
MATGSGAALARRALWGAGTRCIYRACQPAIQKRYQTIQSASSTTPPLGDPSDPTPPPPRSRTSRVLGATALFVLATAAGLAMSVAPAIETANGFLS